MKGGNPGDSAALNLRLSYDHECYRKIVSVCVTKSSDMCNQSERTR